jgi:hypothetical protein
MSGSYNQRYVVCPFYVKDDGRSKITCEGHYDGSRTGYTFAAKETYTQHIRMLCSSMDGCKRCQMYRSIMDSKYGGE